MKIASCITILTFAVYVDFVGSSSPRAGPSHVSPDSVGSNPRSDQECECLNIDGYDILMKRDPATKELIYIRLRDENTQWLTKKTYMVHVIVRSPKLEFVAFASASTGRWLALKAIHGFYRRALRERQAPVCRIENPIKLITLCDCLPDQDPTPVVSRSESSFWSNISSHEMTTTLERSRSREKTLPRARAHSSARPPPAVNCTVRARSRSPSAGHSPPVNPTIRTSLRSPSSVYSFSDILGFEIKELRFIRLTPNRNASKTYELHRYTFPSDNRIMLRSARNLLIPPPIEEQFVITALNGDALAILEKYYKQTLLRGMYEPVHRCGVRAKINVYSGKVEDVTPEENEDCQLGTSNGVSKRFKVFRVRTV